MRLSPARDVDPIKELRLRRWAREHYVSPEQRMSHWHPIVLDEMATRDLELGVASLPSLRTAFRSGVCPYVPLWPSDHAILHAAHIEIPAPTFLARSVESPIYIPG